MIKAIIYQNKKKQFCGYLISGHAGFAQEGEDIVCAAVSILAINTVNAIQQFTVSPVECTANEYEGGYLKVMVTDLKNCKKAHDAELLLKAMAMGLENIAEEYKKYIRLKYEEV